MTATDDENDPILVPFDPILADLVDDVVSALDLTDGCEELVAAATALRSWWLDPRRPT